MAASYPSQLNPGAFIALTSVWDVARLQDIDVNTPEFKELLVRLYQNINNIVMLLNIKDTGYYTLQEFLNGQAFFPNPLLSSTTPQAPTFRQVFRKTFNIGALPAGVTTVAHNLTIQAAWSFTRIYGVASDTIGFNYYPLPFASAGGAANIELRVDLTNIIITNNSGVVFDKCYVVLEYIKQ